MTDRSWVPAASGSSPCGHWCGSRARSCGWWRFLWPLRHEDELVSSPPVSWWPASFWPLAASLPLLQVGEKSSSSSIIFNNFQYQCCNSLFYTLYIEIIRLKIYFNSHNSKLTLDETAMRKSMNTVVILK